jgi:hypothetical protein
MGPGRLATYPQRLWTVDIRTDPGPPAAVCRTCGPLNPGHRPPGTLRTIALRHLAAHARRDVTPPHLRTCQCGQNGCRWHSRHRGCAGPIQLALTRNATSRTWQLTDTCRQCCLTIPDTAAIPEHSPPPTPTGSARSAPLQSAHLLPALSPRLAPPVPTPGEDDDQAQVWDTVCPRCPGPAGTCWWAGC